MSRDPVRLPELRETSTARARFVRRTFGVVIGWLVLLVLGTGWAIQTLTFDLDLPVTGEVVAIDPDGTTRVVLVLGPAAPAAPRVGDAAELAIVQTQSPLPTGEVVAVGPGRIDVVVHGAPKWAVGTAVEGRLTRNRRTVPDLLRIIHSAGP